jgi:hypothetical protein
MTKERREQLIVLATENALGSMFFRENFDGFLHYLAEDTDEVIDFTYDDLTSEEAGIIDELGFECEECGWFCEVAELAVECTADGNVCENCHTDHEDEEPEEY